MVGVLGKRGKGVALGVPHHRRNSAYVVSNAAAAATAVKSVAALRFSPRMPTSFCSTVNENQARELSSKSVPEGHGEVETAYSESHTAKKTSRTVENTIFTYS